jgi:gamma-glutamyltranspeptidase/glutathione hydrolase
MVKSALPRIARVLVAGMALFVSCTTTTNTPELPGVGPVVDRLETEASHSLYGMVSTAHQDASRIAVEVLESGGNAIDAAVAAAFAVGVSDSGDSGLGGTTYILIRFADGRATAIDGSALVPLRVDRRRLAETRAAGAEYGMELAAVPATLAALDYAASTYGTRSLAELIEPSIDLATRGFHATPFHEVAIRTYFDDLLKSDYLKYFVLENGEDPPSIETVQCRPVLANTLRRIAVGGSAEFYRGAMAAEIEADMAERGGFVSLDDLALLRVREVTPLRGTYRGVEVLALPYPTIGGAVIEALNILEQYPPDFFDQDTVSRYQVFAEAFHIATADHSRMMLDGSFVGVNDWQGLLTKGFAAERAALIKPGQALVSEEFPPGQTEEVGDGNTTQISVVDRWGNAVSLTQSLGRFFGNKLANPGLGFPYNSLLEGVTEPTARAPIPSTMCPTIVAQDGAFLLVLGSGSSTRIPGIVSTVISNIVDRKFDLRRAVLAPRILWGPYKGSSFYAEIIPPVTEAQIDELGSFGYEPMLRTLPPARLSNFSRFGSTNSVYFDHATGLMTGVGDPRRNGTALGAGF